MEGGRRRRGRNGTAAERRERATAAGGEERKKNEARETRRTKPEELARAGSKRGENQPKFRSSEHEKVQGECLQDAP